MGTINRLASLSSSAVARYLLKSLVLWAIILSALSLEFWFCWTWMPKFQLGPVWSVIYATTAMMLLPLIAMAFFFRLPAVRKRLPVNYVIKPVQCLRVPATLDPQAVTMTLRRDVSRLQASAREIAVRSPLQTTTATLTIWNLSIPLDWLWGSFKRLIMGSQVIVIDSMLFDTETPSRLVVWVNGPAYHAEHKIEAEQEQETDEENKQSSGLERAALDAALGLIERLEPALGAAFEWEFQNYDAAFNRMLSQPPSFARDLDLARLLVACNRDELAREQLHAMDDEHFMFSARRAEVALQLATIDIKVGEYKSARETLDRLLRRRNWRGGRRRRDKLRSLRRLLGDCDRDDERFEDALRAYSVAESQALDELRRILRLPAKSNLDACLQRSLVRSGDRVVELLGELDGLCESIASCFRLQRLEVLEVYRRQLRVLDVLRQINASQADVVARIAHVKRYAASASPQSASDYFSQALGSYEEAITLLKSTEFFDRNFKVRTELAWCEFGKLLCERALLELEQPANLTEELVDNLRMVFRLGKLLPSEDFETVDRMLSLASGELADQQPARVDALGKAAALLTKALFGAKPSLMLDIADGIKRLNPSSPLNVDQEHMNAMFERLGTRSPSPSDEFTDCHGLFNTTLRLLDVVSGEKDRDALQSLWSKLRQEDNVNTSLEQCREKFTALTRSGHHAAEFFYGLACVNAILHDAANEDAWIAYVADNLEQAIALSRGEKTASGFIGRARIDPDFDGIREHPEIHRLLDLDHSRVSPAESGSIALRVPKDIG